MACKFSGLARLLPLRLFLPGLFVLVLLLLPRSLFAAEGSIGTMPDNSGRDEAVIRANLADQQQSLEERRRQLQILTRQERQLNLNLAQAEERLAELEMHIRLQEEALSLLEQSEQEAALRYAELSREYAKTREQVTQLLTVMWPLYIQQEAGQTQPATWQEAERDFAWSLELSRTLRQRQDELHRQEREVSAALNRQQELYIRLTEQVRVVSSDKDQLLADKLNFLQELQQVRTAQANEETNLASVMETIEAMNLELSRTREDTDFSRRKGRLIRPANGTVVEKFAPNAKPPSRGLGFSLAENAPIRAISGGKVVHSGLLRGFGTVVIVLHESEYYSLYAFLQESFCEVGQMIGPGDTLGLAGFYPSVHGPGLYFELRFQKKAINPEPWLAANV